MKAFNQGAFIRVTASCDDVERFADKWPCNGFRYGDRVSATFQQSNGDLVDLICTGTYGDSYEGYDGGAMVALTQDMQTYAEKRGLLN